MPKREDERQILQFPTGMANASANPPISETGGTGGGGSMDPQSSMKDYIDSRDDAVESRLSAKLDRLPTKGTVWAGVAAIVGSIFSALAITLGLIAFGGDRFDAGMSVSPAIQAAQQKQADVDRRQDAQLSVMDDKLDLIIKQTADGE